MSDVAVPQDPCDLRLNQLVRGSHRLRRERTTSDKNTNGSRRRYISPDFELPCLQLVRDTTLQTRVLTLAKRARPRPAKLRRLSDARCVSLRLGREHDRVVHSSPTLYS